jgi:hypothetical protein
MAEPGHGELLRVTSSGNTLLTAKISNRSFYAIALKN